MGEEVWKGGFFDGSIFYLLWWRLTRSKVKGIHRVFLLLFFFDLIGHFYKAGMSFQHRL